MIFQKIKNLPRSVGQLGSAKKNIIFVLAVIIAGLAIYSFVNKKKIPAQASQPKTTVVSVDKSYNFSALNNQGKSNSGKIKLTMSKIEKTNQVLVNSKVYPAVNDKMFLIVNLELKNDSTQTLNIVPGDLVRLMIGSDKDNKFAPDLHNNVVPVAPISTKLDRIGFVIPIADKNFTLYIGELEGKKDEIPIVFPN